MWSKIRSWHIVKFDSRGGQHKLLCGKWSTGDTRDDFPKDEKTCESCLRIEKSRPKE